MPAARARPTPFGTTCPAPLLAPDIGDLAKQRQSEPAPAAVFAVKDPVCIVRAKSAADPLIVDGDGEGLVDAAASGVLNGSQLVISSPTFDGRPAALRRGLQLRGVTVTDCAVEKILREAGHVAGVQVQGKRIACGLVVLTAGAWSGALLPNLKVKPIKGEMLLLRGKPGVLDCIILDGEIYLVPRKDGCILVGSTVEDAGFDTLPTCAARAQLLKKSRALLPALAEFNIEQHWAGLRPQAPGVLPLIGAAGINGLYLNTGHFRLGITLAPASAKKLSEAVTQATKPAAHP